MKKANQITLAILLLGITSCDKIPQRTSRHTPYCACEHIIAGKVQILQIADQESEQILDLLIEMNGLQKSNFKLCFAKMKGYAGLSTVRDNGAYIYLNPKSLDENNEGLNTYKIYLIAHELGHLLAHHTVLKYQAIDQENECSILPVP
ncbi:MAG: hypothetical protein IPP42_17545 [Saprospiraceae bacterium]|nr:hypothetical protein [Saprospiraceae bacterium]